jgi:hypothetical protein
MNPTPSPEPSEDGNEGGPQGRASRVSGLPAGLEPSHEQIAQRAYELYVQRGDGIGRAEDDWLRAKRELESRCPGVRVHATPPSDLVVGNTP